MQVGNFLVDGHSAHFPELLLPDQFFSDRLLVGQAWDDLALGWAVFSDGLRQYWEMAADSTCSDSEKFCEEERWVLADDTTWPFAFASLCKTFGLNTESVRAALLAWKNAHLAQTARAENEKKSLRAPQA